jgi:hypothetical protein
LTSVSFGILRGVATLGLVRVWGTIIFRFGVGLLLLEPAALPG